MSRCTSVSEFLNLSPYEFEESVAELWERDGWKTEVTQGSNDYGIDIVAEKKRKYAAIQAKRYSPETKVGGPEIRKYATLYQQDCNIDNVVIATTSSFTTQAVELGESLEVSLVNGQDLVEKATRRVGTDDSQSESVGDRSRRRMRNKFSSDPRQALDELLEQHRKGAISKRKFSILKRIVVDEMRENK